MSKTIYTIGQQLELEMLPSQTGHRPIARTDSGLICVIDKQIKGHWFENSIWLCEVTNVLPKKLIIKPVKELKSQRDNRAETAQKMASAFAVAMEPKRKKQKYSYEFKRKTEI